MPPHGTSRTTTEAAIDDGDAGQPVTQTTSVYLQIRSDVLAGRLQPGERLGAEAMRQRFNTGSSPVREALNRLLSEGFVSLEKHKGFRVAPVSRKELSELVKARAWIDGIAVAESIRGLDTIWEETLVVTLHRLSRATRDGPDGHAAGWEALHKAFHVALVSGCGSSWITQISERLFDAAERYRMLGSAYVPARNELEEHQAIVDACFRRDVDRAVELLGQHYQQTFDVFVGQSEP